MSQLTAPAESAKADLYARDLSDAIWLVAPDSDPSDRLEAAFLDTGAVAVRHSANPAGTILRYTPQEWAAFLLGVQDGEFDSDMAAANRQAVLSAA